ncbi:methyltransferase domain-containing protein [Bacillus sp. FSL R10-2789]|uniref:methyltransferase domain-containing protein n=1 Tax=Bacillus sp. FSL R10-2789 TaxID=2954662 RepID=UPI0030F92D55
MLTQQTTKYFEQMDKSVGDKTRMWPHISGTKVLDAGCGSGGLMKALIGNGFDAFGIDLSLMAYEQIKKDGLKDKFILGDLGDIDTYFQPGDFDTVIFSSVLHEVYSYSGFDEFVLRDVIASAYNVIPRGGRIIIRDGVKPIGYEKRIIRFKDINDVLFLKEYCKRFKGRKVEYKKIDSLTYEMQESDAMEFLYTFTWGWESFDREVQEQYGVFDIVEYCAQIIDDHPTAKIKHAESYLQHGYEENLKNKIEFFYEDMEVCKLPDSNMILVIEKG